ncbi:MAG: hypothetical protein R3F11_09615 [Verrucomicrobiales bacterium]
MSAVLRVFGDDLAIKKFLGGSKLIPIAVFQRGEPRSPASRPNGSKHKRTGANFSASDASMSDFRQQLKQATAFLRDFASEIRSLRAYPGVEGMSLDFGVETNPPHWASFGFPADLVAAAGELKINLVVSVFPAEKAVDSSDW